ncbi:hypothetical protein FBEOM_11497 [Fusarium beomiforme]|uniref:Uncharacterized protein n=1 Tax=Fusarium beomiforme TaxID=44412 RepID=A0A9P5DTY1_9HYPO|nr:hypothetical protein FBEOM_11497 [Fusarium beomiforme]
MNIQSLATEVLGNILSFVRNDRNGQEAIQQCRLVSRCFNNAASPFLFPEISVYLTSKSFARLEDICYHPIFSKSVQKVIIITSYYETELACDRPLFMREAKARLLRHVESLERLRSYQNKYAHTQEQYERLSDMAWGTSPEFDQLFNDEVDESSPTPVQKLFLKLYDIYKQLYDDQQRLRESDNHISRLCAALSSLSNLVSLELNDVKNLGGMEHLDAADFVHTGYDDAVLQHFSPIIRKSRWCGSFYTIHTTTPPVEMLGLLCSQLAEKELKPKTVHLRLVPPPSMQAWQLSPAQQTGVEALVSQTTKLTITVDFDARSFELKECPRHEMLALFSITRSFLSARNLEHMRIEFPGYPPLDRRPTVSLTDVLPLDFTWPQLKSLHLHNQPFTVPEIESMVTWRCGKVRTIDLQACWLLAGEWAAVEHIIRLYRYIEKHSIKYSKGGD